MPKEIKFSKEEWNTIFTVLSLWLYSEGYKTPLARKADDVHTKIEEYLHG